MVIITENLLIYRAFPIILIIAFEYIYRRCWVANGAGEKDKRD